MNRKRRSFSKEFKREAVALVTEHGYSYAEAGRSLDVEAKLVGRWRRELEAAEGEAFSGKGKLPPMQQRIHDLESQVKRLQMEKDILKKAAAFFAKEST
jgi:transposase